MIPVHLHGTVRTQAIVAACPLLSDFPLITPGAVVQPCSGPCGKDIYVTPDMQELKRRHPADVLVMCRPCGVSLSMTINDGFVPYSRLSETDLLS